MLRRFSDQDPEIGRTGVSMLVFLPRPTHDGEVGLGLVEVGNPDGCFDREPPTPGYQGRS